MAIHYLDGRRLRRAIVGGADWVRSRRDHINRINVFPVADGDTGTNMALSLAGTASAVRAGDQRDLASVANMAAEASVLGAKGNSGVILAHWFLALARSIADAKRATATDVCGYLHDAGEAVMLAVETPVEGTILTVMRDVGAHARSQADKTHDLQSLLDTLLNEGKLALARTPDLLPVLKDNGVVDAGAQGFVDFLEGIAQVLAGVAIQPVRETDPIFDAEHPIGDAVCEEERFCTEVVVRGKHFDEQRLRATFRGMGGCLLVATTGSIFKLHIHTGKPETVIRRAGELGDLVEQKVDDMLTQNSERASQRFDATALASQPDCVAIVCDSTADLPDQLRAELGIEMAPLQIMFGDEVYRDQVDLSTAEFYQKLKADSRHPSTSQPAPRAFVEALDRIRPDRSVLIVSLSAALSGTHQSAVHAIRLAAQDNIQIFDSRCVSLGLGMMVANAARYAQQGASVEELTIWLARWRDNTHLVFSVDTLDYLRRGGRISATRHFIGGLLGVRPILGLESGKIVSLDKARSAEDLYARSLEKIRATVPVGATLRLGLLDAGNPEPVDRLETQLQADYRVLDCLRVAPSGVIGAHAGPGAWGLFYQQVRDDDPLLDHH